MKFKAKVAHVFPDGSEVEYETYLESENHQKAYLSACDLFYSAIKNLNSRDKIQINKSKIESIPDTN